MKETGFDSFVRSFFVSIHCLANQTVTYMNGESTLIGRKHNGNLCAVNMRLLYRIAMRDSFMEALEYFISDQFIKDAYDEEEVGIKLLPLESIVAMAA